VKQSVKICTLTPSSPIARFATDLRAHGQWDYYNQLLIDNFNPSTVEELMCRNTINIGWKGEVFDCDFNQMLFMQQKAEGENFSFGISRRNPCRISQSPPPTIASAAPPVRDHPVAEPWNTVDALTSGNPDA
jgi:hypothetical protein